MKPLLLLDLDRTLFDTDEFSDYVVKVLTEVTGMSYTTIKAKLFAYSDGSTNHLRHTNFTALLNDLHVNYIDIERAIKQAVPADALLLPDVPEFLRWLKEQTIFDPRILSFGQKGFQQIKLATCPAIGWLPVDIILERKNAYISSTYKARSGVLIDDKPDQQLPDNWVEVTISRSSQSTQRARHISDTVWEITTLMQIKDIRI